MQWIFVGLGNPGGSYDGTRHNVGRFCIDHFARSVGTSEWQYKKVYDAFISSIEIEGKSVLLMKPETYMNESGKSLIKLVKHPEQAEQTVILHDDIDLPIGTWKISFDRGAGGQKGVLSVIETLKTKAFIRIRIGIAPIDKEGKILKPTGHDGVSTFVLGKMDVNEIEIFERVAKDINKALYMIISEGIECTMNKWN